MFTSRRIATSGGNKFRDEHSMAFDGSNDYCWIGETTYNVDGASLSFVFWVKFTRNNAWETLIGKAGVGGASCIMKHNDTDQIRFETDTDGTKIDFTTSTPFVSGEWNHLAFITIGDGSVVGYHNGLLMSASSETLDDNMTISTINNDTGNRLAGSISELAIYDKSLSASEVKTLYNGREAYDHKNGIATANLLKWYRFGDGVLDEADNDTAKSLVMGEKLGAELWTSNATNGDATNWGGYGDNTVTTDSGMVKGTNDGDSRGIYHYLRGAFNLSGDLTLGAIYKLQFDGKVNSGSADLYIGNAKNPSGHTFSNTSMETFVFYFSPIDPGDGSGDDTYFRINNLGEGQIVHLDNFSLREVQGSPGLAINMDSNDIEGDVPK